VSEERVHPTAIVHSGARLAPGVAIGAYSIIGEHVVLGEGTWIGPHVVIEGRTRLGRNNRVYQFASIGAPPQDKKYAGEPTVVQIGDGNTIREGVTINRGTAEDTGITRIGDDNWLMGSVHIAHDCHVGNNTIMANYTGLAGHVQVGDWVILGGATVVHQFVNIGAHGFTSMGTYLAQDLPPYVMAAGNMGKPFGINSEGLRRRGFAAEAIAYIKQAYRTLYRSGLGLEEAKRQLKDLAASSPEVGLLLEFLERSKRGFIR
jgi:UDP-N-acetylglucosamine acyltransferase